MVGLPEGVRLSPTNGLAYVRLTKLVLAQDEKQNLHRVGEADFYSGNALKWAPNDPEMQWIRAEIVETIAKLPKP